MSGATRFTLIWLTVAAAVVGFLLLAFFAPYVCLGAMGVGIGIAATTLVACEISEYWDTQEGKS